MIHDMHRLLSGGVDRDGRRVRGVVDMVFEDHEIIHGTEKDPGLISKIDDLRIARIKITAWCGAVATIICGVWKLIELAAAAHGAK